MLGFGRRTCQLVDIHYVEILNEDVLGPHGEVQGCLVTQRWWMTDDYGNKQALFETGQEIIEGQDLLSGRIDEPFPYYQCSSCSEYLSSWSEAKIHVGDDEDIDEPVLRFRLGRP